MNNPGVSISMEDRRVLGYQLGAQRVDIVSILERCPHGYPSLVLLDPTPSNGSEGHVNFMAVSNLLWLTCPYLNEKIHELESRGFVDRIGRFIMSDRSLMSRLSDAHASFYFLRKNVYRYYVGGVSSLEENGRFLCTGIGGIRDIEGIKCLHLHYAHWRLCSTNPVGPVVESLLGRKTICEEGRCAAGCLRNRGGDSPPA